MRDELIRLADRLTPIVGIDPCEAKELAQIERELRQLAERPAAVPDGYMLMPKTPTNEMTSAMADASEDPNNERSSWDLAENMYRAATAAAPKPDHSPDAGNKAPPEGGT